MEFSLRFNAVRLGVVVLADRLVVAAVRGGSAQTFVVDAEQPGVVLREELARRHVAARAAAVALARSAVFVKVIELPAVGGDVHEVVRLNLDAHLPFAADDPAFDWKPMPETARERRDATLQRVLVVAAEPRVVEGAVRLVGEARLRPRSLTVAAHDLLALVRPTRRARVVWLHRAGSAVDLLCLQGDVLVLSRALPPAEGPRLADEVRRSLTAAEWRSCDAVWVSGDAAPDDEALETLGVPVTEPAWTSVARSWVAEVAPEDDGQALLALGVAAGRRHRPLDLLPAPMRPRRLSRAQWATVGVAAGTLLLAGTALALPDIRARRYLADLDGSMARIEPEVQAVERTARELQRKRALLSTIEELEAKALRPLPVLRDLTDLLPNDAWLTTLSLDAKGAELTGQAAAASGLIPLLENSARLERVEFSSPVTRGRDKEQFRIRAAWEPDGQSRPSTGVVRPGAPGPTPAAPAAGAPAPAPPTAASPEMPEPPAGGQERRLPPGPPAGGRQ